MRLRRATFKSSPQILYYPVAEEKAKYAGKEKDPPKDCLCHFGYLIEVMRTDWQKRLLHRQFHRRSPKLTPP